MDDQDGRISSRVEVKCAPTDAFGCGPDALASAVVAARFGAARADLLEASVTGVDPRLVREWSEDPFLMPRVQLRSH
ncbi:hypothetical protein CFP66_39875 [Pseudonocardia sp. MH-G8]|nr:hypothetical protein CFP66_39875 [Pseudonocardia sp. MH-G8]